MKANSVMKTTVRQWGHSLALRIPKDFAEQTNIKKGTAIRLTVRDGQIVMKPLKRPKYSLKELVSKITPLNRHADTDWGRSMGKEAWQEAE